MRTLFVVIALTGLAALVGCSSNEIVPEWEVVWEDNFEGPPSQSPDPSKWRFDIGTDWGNAQLEYDTDRPTNVSLDGNGNLAITAREEDYEGSAYTSGRINTLKLFDATYGRFEARIKLPIGRGVWPAFWLLGANFESVGWPDCGEIDILEYRGQEPTILHGSLHGPGYSGGSAVTGRYTYPGPGGLDLDFHTYAVEWNEERIVWLIDGQPYQTFTRGSLPNGAAWVFNHSFFIILNVAIGGHFVGPPNEQTTFPQTMLVDWVRVHQLKQ